MIRRIYNAAPDSFVTVEVISRIQEQPVETRYSVQNMKCGGCVAKATEALAKLPGYESAEFDLKNGTAVVKGAVDAQAVVRALTGAGYPATPRSG